MFHRVLHSTSYWMMSPIRTHVISCGSEGDTRSHLRMPAESTSEAVPPEAPAMPARTLTMPFSIFACVVMPVIRYT